MFGKRPRGVGFSRSEPRALCALLVMLLGAMPQSLGIVVVHTLARGGIERQHLPSFAELRPPNWRSRVGPASTDYCTDPSQPRQSMGADGFEDFQPQIGSRHSPAENARPRR